jgi:hypothetical protein
VAVDRPEHGPSTMPARSSHARRVRTGQVVGFEP